MGLFANSEPTALSKNPGEEGRSLVATLGPSALEAKTPLAALVRVPFFPAARCLLRSFFNRVVLDGEGVICCAAARLATGLACKPLQILPGSTTGAYAILTLSVRSLRPGDYVELGLADLRRP